MTGEVKGAQSKRCLSRKKQSKSWKFSKNDHCLNETASGTYTALRSRQSALSSPKESSNHLASLSVINTKDIDCVGDDYLNAELIAGVTGEHTTDVFNFCETEGEGDDGKSTAVDELYGSKRKRIDTEELESASSAHVFKFKRTRNAINLKQASLCLEKCQTYRSKTVNPKDAQSTNETDFRDNIKTLSSEDGSLHQVHDINVVVGNIVLKNMNKENLDKENADEMDTVSNEETAKYTEHSDEKQNSSNDRVCPVCSFSFIPAENLDTINKHINSCLDNCSDSRVKEQGSQEVTCEGIGEDLYFCQLCQKDLSRMNSQRRQQHLNRCCDQANEKEILQSNSVPSQAQCPICGKRFKTPKARQIHLKKCAQQYNVETDQLLEIVRREKQQEDRTSVTTGSAENVLPSRNLTGVKRKRRGTAVRGDFDEETQLALALSASMAPPLPPQAQAKGVKGKGKKMKGGSELPALLLRDDESAQRAVMMRAAQVLCTGEEVDEEDEISCTPALAPSRLAQNIPSNQLLPGKETLQEHPTTFASTSETINMIGLDCSTVEGKHMCANSGNNAAIMKEYFASVDPSLSRSFLNVLYAGENNDSNPCQPKAPTSSPLWSLASTKDQSYQEFYVQGLLPPASPVQKNVSCNTFHDQVAANAATKEETSGPVQCESNMQVSGNPNGVGECEEITPSQAMNVQMLMDLCGDDDMSKVLANPQQMVTAMGFCFDEKENLNIHEGTHMVPSGVSKLLQDLSSMVNNSWLSDVVINLKDGQKLMAHSFILSLRSNVLSQMLEEQRSGCKDGGLLNLQFEEVEQFVFEVTLRHIYTGEVIIPEHCALGALTNLAERLELPCLLKACKDTMFRLKQAQENKDGDEIRDCVVIDMKKFEQDIEQVIWTSDQHNDFDLDFQTPRDEEQEGTTDQLNDEDIEEIMIFQTQSLQREGSENLKESSKNPLSLNEQQSSKTEADLTGNYRSKSVEETSVEDSNPSASNGKESKLQTLSRDDNPSYITIEGIDASPNLPEEDDWSRSPVKQTGKKLHDDAEKGEKFQFNGSYARESIVEEDISIKREHLSLPNEQRGNKLLHDHYTLTESCENDTFSPDSCNKPVTGGETISNPDDVEVQRHGIRQICTLELEQSVDSNDKLHLPEEFLEIDVNVDNYPENADIYNVSTDLLNDANQVNHDDAGEPDVSGELDVSGEIQPNWYQDLNILEESCNKPGCANVFVPEEEEKREKEDLQGSPGKVPLSDNEESEDDTVEMAANESITLISDNEEEVLDVSPRKTDVTIVPETPHGWGSTSTKFLSTTSVSEENDVIVTGSSPSKSRRQLSEEANQFLSKLRQRAERSIGNKQVKENSRRNGVTNKSSVKISANRLTTTEKSLGKRDNLGEPTSLSGNVDTYNVSPTRVTLWGTMSASVSPVRTPPRGSKSLKGSENSSCSPGNLNEEYVSEGVEVGNSPSVSPFIDDDVVQTSETCKKAKDKLTCPSERKEISGEKEFESRGPINGENIEFNGDESDDGIYRDFPLSTSSSPGNIMSQPVPSPSYYFFDAVSSPDSPIPCTSPPSQQIALSPDLDSPSLPVDWKSSVATRGMGSSPQSQSPVSPSVCSFSSHHASSRQLENERNRSVKKLEFEQNSDDKEKPRKTEVVKIDLDMPLKERLKAARVGGTKMFFMSDADEGDSDTDRVDSYTRNEDKSGDEQEKNSSAKEEQQTESVSLGDEFDSYDDGGFNVDIDEVNKLEVLNVDGDVKAREKRHCDKDVKEHNLSVQVDASMTSIGKRKVPSSQRRVRDSDSNNEDDETPSKRRKKSHIKSNKQVEQKAKQPVTPMPNYIEMATPVLKNELYKFGVRALPKKKMILKLKEIYDYTHPNEPHTQGSKTSLPIDGVEESGNASSDNSDQEDTEFGDCTTLIEDDVITASQQINGGDLREKLACYIRDNKELYQKVLQFQPLELASLHQQIKSDGISCSLGKLVDFLDQQCITFTTAGSRQPRRRGRKKK